MRVDATNLLNRLGRQDYSYKEFEDRFSELELWPMLEALLKDPRLLELDAGTPPSGTGLEARPTAHAPAPAPAAVFPPAAQSAPPPEPAPDLSTHDPISSVFRRYENPPEPAPAARPTAPGSGQDVRAMLRHLSELGSRGEI